MKFGLQFKKKVENNHSFHIVIKLILSSHSTMSSGLPKEKVPCDACTAMGMEEQFKRTMAANVGASNNKNESKFGQRLNNNNNNNSSSTTNTTTSSTNGVSSKDSSSSSSFWEMKQPPNLVKLGNSTWTLLHTMAAYYPENPTIEKKKDTQIFLDSLAKVYPCNVCADDFGEQLKKNPPKLDSQKQFSQWMCDVHNDINVQLGKPKFDCSQVDKRWKLFVRGHGNESSTSSKH